jgi:hypothetical protein
MFSFSTIADWKLVISAAQSWKSDIVAIKVAAN